MARINEQERLNELTKREREFWNAGIYPAGMDEVGRGPLAGPVVTCCVILPSEPLIEHINDSKKVTELRRTKLAPIIEAQAVAIGYGWCTNGEIDELNILNATKKAFRQAYFAMEHDCSHVLIDAVKGLDIPAEQHSIIHGDALSYLIGAASIAAKVKRDTYMCQMAEKYPEYSFERNKGYGTAEHIAALHAALKDAKFVPPAPEHTDLLPAATEKLPCYLPTDAGHGPVLTAGPDLEDRLADALDGSEPMVALRVAAWEDIDALTDVQYLLSKPLCLVCDDAELLEAALRAYQGRALYEGALPESALLPLCGRYGLLI